LLSISADDIPIAESITTSVNHNGSTSNSLAITDIDGDSLQYSLITDVANGTLSLSASGDYSYTANSGYVGSDSFTYEVSDSKNSAQGTITFTVQAAPVVPKANEKTSSGGGSMSYLVLMSLLGFIRFYKQKII